MTILDTYRLFRGYETPYNNWKNEQNNLDNKRQVLNSQGKNLDSNIDLSQKKARVVADSMLVLDSIAQSKAEDVEAVFQTLQIELLAGLSAVTSIPTLIKKTIPALEKHSENSQIAKKSASLLQKYDKAELKIGKFKIPVSKALTGVAAVVSAFVYIPTVTDFVKNQIGATRRAKFETMQNELSDMHDFSVLNDAQEQEVKNTVASNNKSVKSNEEAKFTDTIQDALDRINIPKSINEVKDLLKGKQHYLAQKEQYETNLKKSEAYFNKPLSLEDEKTAKEDKQIFQNILKQVDLNSQDDLERVEKIVNVGYGSLFVGGFLEYLLSDTAVKALHIKNPIANKALSLGIPLLTYMLLNKNLAKFQNGAIKSVRYKNLTDLVNNKKDFNVYSDEDLSNVNDAKNENQKTKEGIIPFVKRICAEMKEYKRFRAEDLPLLKENIKAKRKIQLTDEQQDDARLLQRNTFMTINSVEDNNQKLSESIEALSEIALAPIEIASTAIGGFLGDKLAKTVKATKCKGLYTALGAVVGFIPSALAEIYTTGQQRQALRISSMLTMEELKDYKSFADYDKRSFKQQLDSKFAFSSNVPNTFVPFQQKFGHYIR
ncbi:MAG: hypothetical protein PHV37_05865 [Candidatus Gastranaerophilales bacterium]|nr:hypothetical protein [Candidatus Gastranaerophilales bacterium]